MQIRENPEELQARLETVEGRARLRMVIVVIDFDGSIDGYLMVEKGGNFELKPGSGQFGLALYDQLIGKEAGYKVVRVTFQTNQDRLKWLSR